MIMDGKQYIKQKRQEPPEQQARRHAIALLKVLTRQYPKEARQIVRELVVEVVK